MQEPFIKKYQTGLSALTVSLSLLVSAFILGTHIAHLAYQHDEIIRTLDRQTGQQNHLLDIYLKGCGK